MTLRVLIPIFIFFFSTNLVAKDLYWIGNTGDWSNRLNWSLSSGGTAANQIPSSSDDVIFDENSFDEKNQTVSFSTVSVNSITVTSNQYPVFRGEKITIHTEISFLKMLAFQSTIELVSSKSIIGSINTGGYILGGDFSIQSGVWVITNDLILADNYTFSASCEKLTAKSKTLKAGAIMFDAVKLNLSDSEIGVIRKIDLSKAVKMGGNPTVSASDQMIDTDIELGDWSSSTVSTKATCGNVTVTAAITSNYNGSDISCSNACDAEVTVTVTSTSLGPFGYSLNNQSGPFQTSNILTGVCAGNQTVWVIDSSQTTVGTNKLTCSDIINPNQPLALSYSLDSLTNPTCPDLCNGTAGITVNTLTGTGMKTVTWGNGESGQFPVQLCTGSNLFTISDVNGCTLDASIEINSPVAILYDLSVSELTCNGDSDAEIIISNESGGNGGPYTFNFSPAPTSGQGTVNGIGFSSGNIVVTVSDVDGCQQDSIVIISDPPVFLAGTADAMDLTCFGICNGQISAVPSGGIAGYTYEWFDNGSGLSTGITDSIATGLCTGDYFVVITDANGCAKTSAVVTISEPLPFALNTSKTDVACLDSCTGIVSASPAGGTPGYNYSWVDISDNSVIGSAPSISDLCAGFYEITVTDSENCVSVPDTLEVLNGLPLDIVFNSVNPDCYNLCDGEITAVPTNQTGFLYSWSNGGNMATISNLCVDGTYIVTVTSDSGCVAIDSFSFTAPVLYDIVINQNDLLCFGDGDGNIAVDVIEGGNGPVFSYDWTVVSSPTDAINGDFTDSIFGLTAQSYELTITDGPGACDTTLSFTITSPPELTITAVDIQSLDCQSICDGQASALPVGGLPPYSFEWFDNATGLPIGTADSIAMNLCEGNYFVVVTDGNNCSATSAVVAINSPPPLTLNLSKIDLVCIDICDGEASSVVTGGTLNYSYSWTNLTTMTNVGNTPSLTALCPGEYELTVVDANNCPPVIDTVTVLNALPIDVSLTGNDPSCYDLCDGDITVAAANSSGFSYVWTPGIIVGQGTDFATDLCANVNYVVEVTDQNGCVEKDSLTLNDVPEYDISSVINDITCFGDNDGSITVTVNSGGTGILYNFNWVSLSGDPFTGQGTNGISDLLAGDYSVTISDAFSCDTTVNFTVNSPMDLEVNTTDIVQISCFGLCDAQISVLPSGGNPGYTYEWIDVANGLVVSNDSIIQNLCAGDYYVRATDTKGCKDSSGVITIVEPPPLTVNASATDITCNGICDGTAQVTVGGGSPVYSYQWTNIANATNVGSGPTLSGLCPGEFQIIITDGTGCETVPDTVEVSDVLAFALTITGTDPNCPSICNGVIAGNVTNGTAPFTWSPSPTSGQNTSSSNYNNLCEGLYTISVEDNLGCIVQDTITLNSPLPFDISVTQVNLQCFGDNSGSISLTVNSGGTGGPYTFNWLPAGLIGSGTNSVSSLIAGNYQVTVSDGTCDTTLLFTITQPEELLVDASVISQSLCATNCEGSAQVTISGGAPNYSISWNDPLMQITNVIADLCPNTYIVTVTDDNLCMKTDSVIITEPNGFTFVVNTTDVDCNGACNGSATIGMIAGGTPSYSVQWNDPSNQTSLSASNLCAGTYQATITDDNNCDTIITVVISEPPAISFTTSVTQSSCFGSCSGEVSASASGGTGPYHIIWYNVNSTVAIGTDATISNLCPGSYYAEVEDANLCTVRTDTLEVTELQEIIISPTSVTDASCGLADGAITIAASGGDGTYNFDWNPGTVVGQGTTTISQLTGGLYQIIVTDGNNCSDSLSIPINSGALEVLTITSTDATCFGLADGTANVNFICLEPNCSIEWSDVSGNALGTNNVVNGLLAGVYYVEVTNGLGCTVIDSIVVSEPNEIDGQISSTDIACGGTNTGTALVSSTSSNLIFDWTPSPNGGQGTNAVSGLSAGIWIVEVSDVNGCAITLSTNVSEPDPIVIDNISASDISCSGFVDGSVSVSAHGGTQNLVYEWFECGSGIPAGNGTLVTGLSPGDYFVVITDGNNCTLNSICVTIGDKDPISTINTATSASCYGLCNGVIVTIPSGGDGTYFYQWKDNNQVNIAGQVNDTINNLCQGNYHVEITDGSGCSASFGPIDLTQPSLPWDIAISPTDVSCFGECDGSGVITVNAGNTAPYNYSWNDPNNQAINEAINLCAGTYEVIITDQINCDTTVTVLISEPAEILANPTQTNILCANECSGEITLAPSGGQSPYDVNWSNGDMGLIASNICAGPITANILDAAGCASESIFVITEPVSSMTIVSSFQNISQCNECNGSATVNVSGGTLPYTFVWSEASATGQGTNNVSDLCSGFISVTITDANGCEIIESFLIGDADGDSFVLNNSDASCFDICDGSATIAPTCTAPACTQAWYNAASGVQLIETGTTISNLCQGDYIVELTNGLGCVSGDTFTINSPDEILIDANITDVTCSGDSDGTVSATVTGGSGAGYSYSWIPIPANGNGSPFATGLTSGTISLIVTDGTNCIAQDSYAIIDTTPITLTTASNNVLCNGFCNGNITVTASGGYGNYTYQWFESGLAVLGQTSATVFNLCPGSYNVQVTDENGCTETLGTPIIITEPTQVGATISDTDISCFGLCDGTATVVGSGGQFPYTYNWFNGSNVLINQTSTVATSLCADNYFAIITDNNNCSVTTSLANVTEPAELEYTITQTGIDCFENCNGSAQIAVIGGVLNYTYEWKNTGTNLIVGTNDSINNLCSGSYSVEVVDFNGCSTGVEDVNIISPTEIDIQVFANNAECNVPSGSATTQVTGGIPGYSYEWLDENENVIVGETNDDLQNVFAGIYHVVVTDANGCDDTIQFVIDESPSTTIQFDAVINPTCFGASDGSIEITIVGNNTPLNFLWNPGGTVAEDPTNLSAGTYTLTVTDALGCISIYDTVLIEPTELNQSPTITDPLCGECDGAVSVAVTGGSSPYNYTWNTGAMVNNIQNLCGGIYQLTVEDDNGCVNTVPYAVGNSAAVSAEAVVTPISCFNSCDGEITVNILTGTAPYTVTWLDDGFTGLTKQNLCADTYFIEVVDNEGCVFPLVVDLVNPNEITAVPTMVLPNCGATDGQISVTTQGGVLPHAYSWNFPPSNTSTVSNIGAGIYILTVTDDNGTGCSQDFTFNLSNITVPQVLLTKSDIDCNGNCNGEISSVTSGGTPNYTYQWFEGDGSLLVGEINDNIIGLCAGSYSIEVTDANGCIAYATEEITEPTAISFNSPNVNPVACFGDCDGSIFTNSFGGTLPYSYVWDDAGGQTNANAINLCDGVYTLTLTDGNGCQATIIDSIVEPELLTITVDSVTAAKCKETLDGDIQATISGGTLNYTINWVSFTGQTYSTEDITGALPMAYYLTVSDANGCIAQDTAIIDTTVVVFVDAGLDTTICFDEEASLIAVSNQLAADYTWFDISSNQISDTNIYITGPLVDGIYTYTAKATFDGCDDFDSVQVFVNSDLVVDAGPDIELKLNQDGVIGGNPTSPTSGQYIWTPSSFLSDTAASNPTVVSPDEDIWYYLEFIDSLGCRAFDSAFVEVVPDIWVPEGISPDGDSKNDIWILEFNEDFPNLEVSVYNRWGELLFYDNTGYTIPWDGTYNGKTLPVGTYYYVVELNSELYPEPFVGPLTIMR
ncbi:MAG: gliding motility-associated C-terminal domain-containing protein [Crocinitomicaceae bacterium]